MAADAGLMLGWGSPVRGREAKALQVFGEVISYYGQAQGEGRIESFEPVLLQPHGGDLAGFFLVRGSDEQIAALQADPEFQRNIARAGLIVEHLGVVKAWLGDGLARQMGVFQEQVGELAG